MKRMKPSKKRAAKRRDSNPIITKLLKLKYRINDTARAEGNWSDHLSYDKNYVMTLMSDIRNNNWTKLSKEDMLKCNGLWKEYSPSRLNDWVSYKND